MHSSCQTIEKETILQLVMYIDIANIIHYNYHSMTRNLILVGGIEAN